MMLREPLAILGILAAAILPGALAVSLWGKRFRTDPLEFLFAALALGVLMLGWLALLLAELGYFSSLPWAALGGRLCLSLGGWLWRARRHRAPVPTTRWQVNRWEIVALGLWALVAAWTLLSTARVCHGRRGCGRVRQPGRQHRPYRQLS